MTRAIGLTITLTLALAVAGELPAQTPSAISVDATVGPSSWWGGRHRYYPSGGAAAELTIAVRPVATRRRTGALSAGIDAAIDQSDICALESLPGSACRPRFPVLAHLGVLGGLERWTPVGSVRALVGPAFFGGEGASGIGAQAQLDASIGFSHVAFIIATRGSWLTRFDGESLRLGSLGFGLRLR